MASQNLVVIWEVFTKLAKKQILCLAFGHHFNETTMKIVKILLTTFCMLLCICGYSQMSGNQAYGNNYDSYNSNGRSIPLQSIRTTDSTLVVFARVLMNRAPDFYFVTLGISQESKTPKEGLDLINIRIANLTKGLSAIGLKKDDYYVDFVSQAKIYDYKVGEKEASQIEVGFEIKKNIIVKLESLDDLDKLIELASQQDIYDIVKVDYRNDDVDSIYEEMYKASVDVIEAKKKLYLKTSKVLDYNKQRVTSDNFYSVYPKSQYKKYQAYETSDMTVYSQTHSANYVKNQLRKSTTFYYDGVDVSGYDKLLNADNPVIGIQYVFELTILYEISR